MPNMLPDGKALSELGQRVLLSLWKLKGIGKGAIKVDSLRADMGASTDSTENIGAEIVNLQNQGFLESAAANGEALLSLTPLGLSVLRQLEEDKLQELK